MEGAYQAAEDRVRLEKILSLKGLPKRNGCDVMAEERKSDKTGEWNTISPNLSGVLEGSNGRARCDPSTTVLRIERSRGVEGRYRESK